MWCEVRRPLKPWCIPFHHCVSCKAPTFSVWREREHAQKKRKNVSSAAPSLLSLVSSLSFFISFNSLSLLISSSLAPPRPSTTADARRHIPTTMQFVSCDRRQSGSCVFAPHLRCPLKLRQQMTAMWCPWMCVFMSKSIVSALASLFRHQHPSYCTLESSKGLDSISPLHTRWVKIHLGMRLKTFLLNFELRQPKKKKFQNGIQNQLQTVSWHMSPLTILFLEITTFQISHSAHLKLLILTKMLESTQCL